MGQDQHWKASVAGVGKSAILIRLITTLMSFANIA